MSRRHLGRYAALAVAPLAALVACSTSSSGGNGTGTADGGASAPPAPVTCTPSGTADVHGFTRFTVDGQAKGASFVATGDMNHDGKKDLVVSKFGAFQTNGAEVTLAPGEVSIYLQGASLDCWQKVDIVTASDGFYFPNRPTVDDLDGDGDLDVVLPTGFFVCAYDKKVKSCGSLSWLENPGSAGGAWAKHALVKNGDAAFYHQAVAVDFDGDGVKDLVTVGETPSSPTGRWFKGNTTADRFDASPLDMGEGLGTFPSVADIDGDGDLDVASAEFWVKNSSFAWMERTAAPSAATPAGTWVRHPINVDSGRAIQLSLVPNLFGDGVTRAVATNHVNANPAADAPDPSPSAVFVFDVPSDPRALWPKKTVSEGIVARVSQSASLAPGVFGYGDVDGDGDIDLAVSGDGDAHTYWLEQTAPGVFATHVLEDTLGQASGGLVEDLDGDGKNEVVFTGYENDAVYVYAHAR